MNKTVKLSQPFCGAVTRPPNGLVLVCNKDAKLNSMSNSINVSFISHKFSTECPCAYDITGKCRQKPHMCTATSQNFFCDFRLKNIIITPDGGLIDCASLTPISFSHPSMGEGDPIYYRGIHKRWQSGYMEAASKYGTPTASSLPRSYQYVVPTR
jgi:hypothetical protein